VLFLPKTFKIFKKQQQQTVLSAGKNTIATEFVAAASSHKHPKAQKRPLPDTKVGRQQQCVTRSSVFSNCYIRILPPYRVSTTAKS